MKEECYNLHKYLKINKGIVHKWNCVQAFFHIGRQRETIVEMEGALSELQALKCFALNDIDFINYS